MPQITGNHISYQLIFLTQGKAPYLLTVGNRAAESAMVPLDTLIPREIRKTSDLDWIAEAEIHENIVLGGLDRLVADLKENSGSKRNNLLVWVVLIVGVAALLFMVWRIWREVNHEQKKSGAEKNISDE